MILVKIGGGESINLEAVITDLAKQEQPFIIVHGANVLRDQLAQKLGMEKTILTSASGYSSVFSDQDAIDVIMMSYAGLRNKRIVELCQKVALTRSASPVSTDDWYRENAIKAFACAKTAKL